MKRIGLFIGLLIISVLCGVGQTAREISDRAVKGMEVDDMRMSAELRIVDAQGRERIRQLTTTTGDFNGVSKTMLKFTEPADVRGTALLIYDYDSKADDMWIYLPALKKTRRIVSSEKGKSFMGSEFTNADMAMPSPDDFDYKIAGQETFQGHDCWKIESVCKTDDLADENGFLKKISWIEKGSYLCYKVEFYDFDGELFKEQLISDYREDRQKHHFAWKMEMRNLDNGRKSVMQVLSFESGLNLSESTFTPAMLE